jgi:hypothetical protein
VRFPAAAEVKPEVVAVIVEQVRVRVLRWLARSGLIERGAIREMLAWENSGFCIDAAVFVVANDLAGLERLFRLCVVVYSMSGFQSTAADHSPNGDVRSWPVAAAPDPQNGHPLSLT